jgi:hypothetical protein
MNFVLNANALFPIAEMWLVLDGLFANAMIDLKQSIN